MKRHLLIAAIAFAAFTTVAHADWLTTVEDDLFSDNKNAVMVGMINQSSGIYATCSGPEKLALAYIEAAEDGGGFSERVPAGDIVFKSDNGERFSSKMSAYTHNGDFAGFNYDDESTLLAAIKSFGNANSKIAIGIDLTVSDNPLTATASARGSSKAVKQFLEACGLVD